MSNNSKFIKRLINISNQLLPDIKNKEKRISQVSKENESTVKNWLFHNRLPPKKKRITISDNFGVSDEFLFGNDDNLSFPIAIYNSDLDVWLIPKVEIADMKNFNEKQLLCVKSRFALKIEEALKNKLACPEKTYCIEIDQSINFPPFFEENDYIFINQTAIPKNDSFCLYIKEDNIEIVKLKINDYNRELVNKIGRVSFCEDTKHIFPIILTISSDY
ncbi:MULTISPECIES: hypothetical protein [Arsenophonus]|uniref:hypothetical protein n=1 Tax=Arsenophonus TaxID=637 RepID=UPI003879B1CD